MDHPALAAVLVGFALISAPTQATAQTAPARTDAELAAGRYTLRGHTTHNKKRTRVRGLLEIRAGKQAGTVDVRLGASSLAQGLSGTNLPLANDTIVLGEGPRDTKRGAGGALAQKAIDTRVTTTDQLRIDVRGDGLLEFEIQHASGATTNGWGLRPLSKRVLLVLSAADEIRLVDQGPEGMVGKGLLRPLVGGSTVGTGIDLSGVVRVVRALKAQGFSVEFATPGGKQPTIDINALRITTSREGWRRPLKLHGVDIAAGQALFGRLKFSQPCPKTDPQLKQLVAQVRRANDRLPVRNVFRALSEVSPSQRLTRYAGVFVADGRANLVDLHQDPDMGKILAHCHPRKKPVGLNGHAPIVLLSCLGVPFTDRRSDAFARHWRYRDYTFAATMGGLEVWAEKWGEHKGAGKVQFHVDEVLERFGATHKAGWLTGFNSYVRVDRELVTGLNAASAGDHAKRFSKQVAAWATQRAKARLKQFTSLVR